MHHSSKSRRYALLLLCLMVCVSCTERWPKNVLTVLQWADTNRYQLESVLQHYKQLNDTLKLKAACYLIGNMMDKHSFKGKIIDRYDALFPVYDSLARAGLNTGDPPEVMRVWDSLEMYYGKLTVDRVTRVYDRNVITADYLIANIDDAFKVWEKAPWYSPDRFDDFCRFVLPYRVGTETLERYRPLYAELFSAALDTVGNQPIRMASVINDVMRLDSSIWSSAKMWEYPFDLPPSKLLWGKRGACRHMTAFFALVLRSNGIPTAVDYVERWGNRSGGHQWLVVLTDSVHYPFEAPAAHFDAFKPLYQPAKIFRKRFDRPLLNDRIWPMRDEVPIALWHGNDEDVTEEYVPCFSISIPVSSEKVNGYHYAVLCVFDNRTWQPVTWGTITRDSLRYDKIASGVVYLPAVWEQEQCVPVGDPFTVNPDGSLRTFVPNDTLQTMILTRKYPLYQRVRNLELSIRWGAFEGANRADFSDADTLLYLEGAPDGYADTLIHARKAYRFVRYHGRRKGAVNMAEVVFYGHLEGQNPVVQVELKGEGIGYPASTPDYTTGFSLAIDGNPETYFSKPSDEYNGWVGYDFGANRRVYVERIRYAPRSDTNFMLEGDTYTLSIWSNGAWKEWERQVATQPEWVVPSVPGGALYLLRNLSRGKEERIFSYENDRQVFW